MPTRGVIVLCHGSRGEKAVDGLPVKMQGIVTGLEALLPGKVAVTWAALQFNRPTLAEAVASLASGGVKSILIVPYFLFSGRHITEDIPEMVRTLAASYPDVTFTMTASIGDGDGFLPQVVDRVREAVPEIWREISASPSPPETIERDSMAIIERFIPAGLTLSDGEKAVIKRIVHASGDPQVISLVRFRPGAVSAGIEALQKGRPILTDVRMVAAGINVRAAEACGCPVLCALEEAEGNNHPPGRTTRAAAAMRHLGPKLNGAVIAIGNAPTALLALLDLIDSESVQPALVIGMPVGFVRAAESKELLVQRRIPFITITGTRGGSAMAAAAVNALLRLALERRQE
ncbi:MAG: precorrin-8X methylmutase [Chloroflexota bacterium]